MKNKKSILIGIILSLFFIFFVNGLLQFLFATLIGVTTEEVKFSFAGFSSIVLIDETKNIYLNSALILAPIIAVVFIIEIAFIVLGKSALGLLRYSTIVFLLLTSGYLIITIFYGLFQLALFPASNSLWISLSKLWQLENNQTYVLLGFVLVVTLAYLQMIQKRLMQYISVNEEERR